MGDLCVEDAVAVDAVLVDKGAAVLAKVVENLYYAIAGQNLLEVARQTVVEWVHAQHVEDVAVVLEAELDQRDRLALD